MKRRYLVLLAVLALTTVSLAADDVPGQTRLTVTSTTETRLSVLETRVTTLEQALVTLQTIPVTLAEIRADVTAVKERTKGNTDVISSLGLSLATLVMGSLVGFVFAGKRKG